MEGSHTWECYHSLPGAECWWSPPVNHVSRQRKKVEVKDDLDILTRVLLIVIVRKQYVTPTANGKGKKQMNRKHALGPIKQPWLCMQQRLAKRYNLPQVFCFISISAAAIEYPSHRAT